MSKPSHKPISVKPTDLYNISRIVTEASDWKTALDQIVRQVRNILIYDNLAVYLALPEHDGLDVMYARAVGRGRSAEADSAWGEELANRVSTEQRIILEEPPQDDSLNRLKRPYLLGIPLLNGHNYLGAIIFVRFGGPSFEADQVALAEFIARQIALLIERQKLEKATIELEAKHKQIQLQEDFVSNISHELRSPLGFIKGYTTTLLRTDTIWDPETQREFLEIIDQETDALQELINNLLDSARLQSGQLQMKFQPIRLNNLLEDIIAHQKLHRPRQVINLQINQPLPVIQGDPLRLSQVFENLLNNAAKYAPHSEVLIKVESDKRGIHILVKDFGPGMSKEYLPMMFTRFFRGPDQSTNSHGSGLGLFICKQIIEAHRGQITADSELGQGMVFHIFLPSEH